MNKTFDYSTWWQENKDSVNERRRKKRASDPDWAEKQRVHSRRYKRKRRARPGRRPKRRNLRKPVIVTFRVGTLVREEVCWSAGVLAEAIGRDKRVIDQWEARGMIPLTPLSDDTGARLYTSHMIDRLLYVVRSRKQVRKVDRLFYFEVLLAWRKVGYDYFVNAEIASIRQADSIPSGKESLLNVESFALAIGRSVSTILTWESLGVLPATPFVFAGKNFYPQSAVDALKPILADYDMVRASDSEAVGRIRAAWDNTVSRLRLQGEIPGRT